MDALVTALDDVATRLNGQTRFPNPFDRAGPSELARIAADSLQNEFRHGVLADGIGADVLDAPGNGKMFGVLVVKMRGGQLGFLRAFSGMLDGRWDLPGFVPPLFDRARREILETEGEATVKALATRRRLAAEAPELVHARHAVGSLDALQAAQREALRERHLANRRQRRNVRQGLAESIPDAHPIGNNVIEELARQSRRDKTERRKLAQEQEHERDRMAVRLGRLERHLNALDRLRRFVSRRLMQQIHDTYKIPNARGQVRSMRDLFAPREPPSGAGDCAGPKLLAYAYRQGLRPLALAEFWWGAPPPTGGRLSGVYYPACAGKCGPLLRYLLDGIDTAPLVTFMPADSTHLDLRIVHADDRIVVVDKPQGLLSVPSSNAAITDSVAARLMTRFPAATGALLPHRLDLDTSGLLVAGLDPSAHAMLQRQFARGTVRKRYLAWIDGDVVGDEGTIDLAIRVDLEDRPRHIHDPAGGRRAVTEWRVVERSNGRTRVELYPLTGRTHQLRVHAAHPLGLGAPIVGDYLYGRGGERLLLHAECLRLRHPSTSELVTFESPAPF